LIQFWEVCPGLRQGLFKKSRSGYVELKVEPARVKAAIHEHPEFVAFVERMNGHFDEWRKKTAKKLKALRVASRPKEVIFAFGEDLLAHYEGRPLIDNYGIYQHLMDYWSETMQDDCYLISDEGWKAETYRIIEIDKKGREKDKGWACDLAPRALVIDSYFAKEQEGVANLEAELEGLAARLAELEEEHGGEEGCFADLERVNKAGVSARLKELQGDDEAQEDAKEEAAALEEWLTLSNKEAAVKKSLKESRADLDDLAYAKYPKLTEAEIKELVVDKKWMAVLEAAVRSETERISQALSGRVKELAERYDSPLSVLGRRASELEAKVHGHLERMGFSWQ